jgi:hypothetical protein
VPALSAPEIFIGSDEDNPAKDEHCLDVMDPTQSPSDTERQEPNNAALWTDIPDEIAAPLSADIIPYINRFDPMSCC